MAAVLVVLPEDVSSRAAFKAGLNITSLSGGADSGAGRGSAKQASDAGQMMLDAGAGKLERQRGDDFTRPFAERHWHLQNCQLF
jgi:hypothetical protein